MKLDQHDLRLARLALPPGPTRPELSCLYLHKGRLVAADGYIMAYRAADCEEAEKDLSALLPRQVLDRVKVSQGHTLALEVVAERATITPMTKEGKLVEYEPSISFGLEHSAYPNYEGTLAVLPTKKQAEVAFNVGLLKRLLSVLPDTAVLKLGIQGPGDCVEFAVELPNRPIRGGLMPMMTQWSGQEWEKP